MTDDRTVTPASEWRRARTEGVAITLPSGKVAALRAVSFELLLRLGRVPDSLTAAVVDVMLGKSQDLPIDTPTQAMEMLRLIDAVCESAFVSPRIVAAVVGDDEITLDDIEETDKSFVFGFLNQPTRALEQFRDAQAPAVDAVELAEGNGTPSEPDREPESVGEA